MATEKNLSDKDKEDILIKNYNKTLSDGVPLKKLRFKMREGIQQKITLISSNTGLYKQIVFVKGVENTINGNIADDLLDLFPGTFSVIKINGKLVEKGAKKIGLIKK